jgi:Family of unknown function (DUF6491)
MKSFALIAALFVGTFAGAQASSAPSASKHGNACIFINSVGQYRVLDRDSVVIWAPGRRNAYLVELNMPLFGLEGAWQMAMIDHDRDGRLCGFGFDRLGVRDQSRPESSTIKTMSKLDDTQLAALEEQFDVKLRSSKKTKTESAEDAAEIN